MSPKKANLAAIPVANPMPFLYAGQISAGLVVGIESKSILVCRAVDPDRYRNTLTVEDACAAAREFYAHLVRGQYEREEEYGHCRTPENQIAGMIANATIYEVRMPGRRHDEDEYDHDENCVVVLPPNGPLSASAKARQHGPMVTLEDGDRVPLDEYLRSEFGLDNLTEVEVKPQRRKAAKKVAKKTGRKAAKKAATKTKRPYVRRAKPVEPSAPQEPLSEEEREAARIRISADVPAPAPMSLKQLNRFNRKIEDTGAEIEPETEE